MFDVQHKQLGSAGFYVIQAHVTMSMFLPQSV